MVRGEAQPQSRSGRQEEEEEEGWSRSALADCPGCPGLTPCTAVRTPVLPPSPPPPQLILMLLSAVFYPATLSPSCSGALPVCLTAAVAHQPLLINFFSLPSSSRVMLPNWEASLLLSVTPKRSTHPLPPRPVVAFTPVCWLLFFPFQGKPREHYTRVIHAAVLVLELYVPNPPDVKFLIPSLLWSSRCCSTLALWPRLLKPGQHRTMRRKLLRLSFILPRFVIVSSLYVEHE